MKSANPQPSVAAYFFESLTHELKVHGGPGNGRLGIGEGGNRWGADQDFVVFVRRDFIPMQRGNDCAVREREFPFPIGLYGYVIAQLGAHLLRLPAERRPTETNFQSRYPAGIVTP